MYAPWGSVTTRPPKALPSRRASATSNALNSRAGKKRSFLSPALVVCFVDAYLRGRRTRGRAWARAPSIRIPKPGIHLLWPILQERPFDFLDAGKARELLGRTDALGQGACPGLLPLFDQEERRITEANERPGLGRSLADGRGSARVAELCAPDEAKLRGAS